MSKALLLSFHWRNLFPVMEAKGPALCRASQSAVMDLQQGYSPGPHPQCPEPDIVCAEGAMVVHPRTLCVWTVHSSAVQQP